MLLLEIDDPSERIICIELTRELGVDRLLPHAVSWEARLANTEGKGAITQAELVEDDALRMEPTRIIIGEARGAEAYTLLEAMNTGHSGSMSSVHAQSARDALRRLKAAAKHAQERPSEELLNDLIASNIQVIVHLGIIAGKRVVTAIVEVEEHLQNGIIPLRQLWVRQNGRLERTIYRPERLLGLMETAGYPYAWEAAA
jgi:pilus assembly protein CpaF